MNQNPIFGKFQKNKIDALSSIKGGLVSSDTTTTLCATNEGTFDTDSQGSQENLSDPRCSGNAS